MQPSPHCHRCGYANAPSWARCCCCGRPIGDHRLPKGTRVVRASAGRRPRRHQELDPRPKRSAIGLGPLVTPAASLVAIAGAWLGPVTADERAGLLTAAAAASTFAALRLPTRSSREAPARRERSVRRPETSSKESSGWARGERVDDLEALIAAW